MNRIIELVIDSCENCPFYRYVEGGSNSDDYEYCSNQDNESSNIKDATQISETCPLKKIENTIAG